MKVPMYEQQVDMQQQTAARGEAAGPVAGAYGENIGSALKTLGAAEERIGSAAASIAIAENNINLGNFEDLARIELMTYQDKLGASNDVDSFGAEYTAFIKDIEDKGVKQLGERAYNAWKGNQGQVFFKRAEVDTARIATDKKVVRAQNTLQDTVKKEAQLALDAKDAETFALQRERTKQQIENAYKPNEAGIRPILNDSSKRAFEDLDIKSLGEAADKKVTVLLDNNDIDGALRTIEMVAGSVDNKTLESLKKQVEGKKYENLAFGVWDEVRKSVNAEGEVDLLYMDTFIDHMDIPRAEKEQLYKDTEARAREQNRIFKQNYADQDYNFGVQATQAFASKRSLDDTKRELLPTARDSRDRYFKEKQLNDIWAGNENRSEDVKLFVALRDGIREGTTTRGMIENAYDNDGINAGSYKTLTNMFFTDGVKGKSLSPVQQKQLDAYIARKFEKEITGKTQQYEWKFAFYKTVDEQNAHADLQKQIAIAEQVSAPTIEETVYRDTYNLDSGIEKTKVDVYNNMRGIFATSEPLYVPPNATPQQREVATAKHNEAADRKATEFWQAYTQSMTAAGKAPTEKAWNTFSRKYRIDTAARPGSVEFDALEMVLRDIKEDGATLLNEETMNSAIKALYDYDQSLPADKRKNYILPGFIIREQRRRSMQNFEEQHPDLVHKPHPYGY
ncbi:hypothetical protein AAIR98_001431 [Elusimicrobium simillimum]|uniref:hypothetical protein n=1 Tax=Elusimicrobium simillimum TaxID=3143438 RepID=UPI003C6FDAEA